MLALPRLRPSTSAWLRCASWSTRPHRPGGGRRPRGCPECPAAGNSPRKLAHQGAGKGAARRPRSLDHEGQARLLDPRAPGRLRPPARGARLARGRNGPDARGPLCAGGPRREGKTRSHRRRPALVKQAINAWMTAAGIEEGRLLRRVLKSGKVGGGGLSAWAVWSVCFGECSASSRDAEGKRRCHSYRADGGGWAG